MRQRLWVLGAPDPEMERIEALLREAGETVAYALVGSRRVLSGEAYSATSVGPPSGATRLYWVECRLAGEIPAEAGIESQVVIDHHRPGDPGYGRPPAEYITASSIGQVSAELARLGRLPWPASPGQRPLATPPAGEFVPSAEGHCWKWFVGTTEDLIRVPPDLILAAASDHCPAAAYRGRCPGDPLQVLHGGRILLDVPVRKLDPLVGKKLFHGLAGRWGWRRRRRRRGRRDRRRRRCWGFERGGRIRGKAGPGGVRAPGEGAGGKAVDSGVGARVAPG